MGFRLKADFLNRHGHLESHPSGSAEGRRVGINTMMLFGIIESGFLFNLLGCSFVGAFLNVIHILYKSRVESGFVRPDWKNIAWGLVCHTLLGPFVALLAPLASFLHIGQVVTPQALSLIGGFFATNMIDAIKALWKMKDSNEGYVKGVSSSLNFRQQKALEYLQGTNVMGNDDYQRINKVSDSTAQSELNDLLKKEFIRRVGRTRGIRYIL